MDMRTGTFSPPSLRIHSKPATIEYHVPCATRFPRPIKPTMSDRKLLRGAHMVPGEPLWQRVPSQDAQGRNLFDFMMLIPKFKEWPDLRREQVMTELQSLFDEYDGKVVFAELNMKLNLLWVSLAPAPGICLEFAAAINERIPEAVLVANRAEALYGAREESKRRRWRLLPRGPRG